MSPFRMNKRARFLARVEHEGLDDALVHDEAPAPDAAVWRHGRCRARRARQAAEVEPEVLHADIDKQVFMRSMQDNCAAIRDFMLMIQQMRCSL